MLPSREHLPHYMPVWASRRKAQFLHGYYSSILDFKVIFVNKPDTNVTSKECLGMQEHLLHPHIILYGILHYACSIDRIPEVGAFTRVI